MDNLGNITRGDYEICKLKKALSGYDKDPNKKICFKSSSAFNKQDDQNFKYVNTPSIKFTGKDPKN